MSVVIITASSGNNLKLAESFQNKFVEYNVESTIVDLADIDLPLYSTQAEEKIKNPLHQELLDLLDSSTKFVFVSPEYNGSTPPSFQNFLAWASRSSKEWRRYFNGKQAVIATHSGGGGSHVLMHMRLQLSFIGMNVLGREILTSYQKELNPESLQDVCQQLVSQ